MPLGAPQSYSLPVRCCVTAEGRVRLGDTLRNLDALRVTFTRPGEPFRTILAGTKGFRVDSPHFNTQRRGGTTTIKQQEIYFDREGEPRYEKMPKPLQKSALLGANGEFRTLPRRCSCCLVRRRVQVSPQNHAQQQLCPRPRLTFDRSGSLSHCACCRSDNLRAYGKTKGIIEKSHARPIGRCFTCRPLAASFPSSRYMLASPYLRQSKESIGLGVV